MNKLLIGCITFITLITLIAGCAGVKDSIQEKRNPLRVGITPNHPPIIYKQDGKVVGVEADLAKKLAADLNRNLKFVELEWDALVPALKKGEIDIIMSGVSITPARKLHVQFSKPYLKNGLLAVVSVADKGKYTSKESIMGFTGRIGAIKNTTAEKFIRQNCQLASIAPIEKLAHVPFGFQGKQISMFINDVYTNLWLVSRNEQELAPIWTPLTEEDYGWAINRENQELVDAVNTLITQWTADGSLKEILLKHLPYLDRIQWEK